MGKKILCLLAAVCLAFTFAACSSGKTVAADNGIDRDGGFVAETKDYVYFINGVESYSTEYKTGDVVKGALQRVKKSAYGSDSAEYETIVSKLIVSSDYDAGFYIYGDYVYYAVPSAEKDKTGAVKSDKLNFFRTNLDASKTSSKIADKDFNRAANFRYIASGDKVYLAVYSTDLYVYDADTCKLVFSTEDTDTKKGGVSEVMFDEDNAAACVYYSFKPIDLVSGSSDSTTEEDYHDLYKVTLGATVSESKVYSGMGDAVKPDGDNTETNDFIGLTVDLIRHKSGTLYFSTTSLNSLNGGTIYYSLADDSTSPVALVRANGKTTAAFADAAFFRLSADGSLNHTLYVDSSYGLMKYDYRKSDDSIASDRGENILTDNATIKASTLLFISTENSVDYLYFKNSDSNVCKVNLSKIESGEEITDDDIFRINTLSLNGDWYNPEVVKIGDAYHFVCVYSSSDYDSYLYSIDMAALKTAYDAAKEEAGDDFDASNFYSYDKDKESDAVKLGKLLGVKDVAEK